MTAEFAHDTAGKKFTMHVDGDEVAYITYTEDDTAISLVGTYSAPEFRGKGYALELMKWVADTLEVSDTRPLIAVCPFVANWFARHGERGYLLTR